MATLAPLRVERVTTKGKRPMRRSCICDPSCARPPAIEEMGARGPAEAGRVFEEGRPKPKLWRLADGCCRSRATVEWKAVKPPQSSASKRLCGAQPSLLSRICSMLLGCVRVPTG